MVAAAILKTRMQCYAVGTEVYGLYEIDNQIHKEVSSAIGKSGFIKSIADVAGVKMTSTPVIDSQTRKYTYVTSRTVYCIESKVSKSDFKNGFCTGGHLNYIISPKGILSPDEIPNKIGLIEVDLDNLSFGSRNNHISGVEISKRPRRIERHPRLVSEVTEAIVRGLTNEAIYKNPWFYPGYKHNQCGMEQG